MSSVSPLLHLGNLLAKKARAVYKTNNKTKNKEGGGEFDNDIGLNYPGS